MATNMFFVIKKRPPLHEIAGMRLDSDTTPLSSILESEPSLIDGDYYTPVAGYWENNNSYGFELGGTEALIDGVDIWTQIDTTDSIYLWQGSQNKIEIYGSNDNSTWELIRTMYNAPIFQSGSGVFATRLMFDTPVYYKYLKFHNAAASGNLMADGNYSVEICELYHRIEETPTMIWSSTEQYTDFGGAMSNSLVAVKQTGTTTGHILATIGRSTGKYYFEINLYSNALALTNTSVGVRRTQSDSGADYSSYVGKSGGGSGYMAQGRFYREGSLIANEAQLTYAYPRSETIGVAADLDNGYLWFNRDGIIVNQTGKNGNPTTGVDPAITMTISGTYYPAVAQYYSLTSPGDGRYTSARLNARYSNVLYLPDGYTPWDE